MREAIIFKHIFFFNYPLSIFQKNYIEKIEKKSNLIKYNLFNIIAINYIL